MDTVPWTSIYVASPLRTLYLSHTLPHWLVADFIEEFCRFFNCTLVTDSLKKTVRIAPNSEYFGSARQIEISPVDEYTAELSDESESHSLATDNLRYDLSSSSEHDYDVIDDNIRNSAPSTNYDSHSEAASAYRTMDADTRAKMIFRSPLGLWTAWQSDYTDVGGGTQTFFTQIDVFGTLFRDSASENETTLKICPVAIAETTTNVSGGRSQWTYRMPSLENPKGDERDTRGRGSESESSTIQEYVEGDADIEKAEKEDRMQVFFLDDIEQDSICVDASESAREGVSVGDIRPVLMPFTDFLYKKNHGGNSHRQWSLSLNPSAAEHYLGQLHQNSYSFNMKAKYCVKFLADEMPDPTQVFVIRNKRFACEKIEAQIDDQGLQQLMTGYFYEML